MVAAERATPAPRPRDDDLDQIADSGDRCPYQQEVYNGFQDDDGCPDVVETIKWGSPHFEHHGMLCGMAAFKEHCAFGFWNRALRIPERRDAMGQFGCIRSLADLPKDSLLVSWVREATRLNETGRKVGPIRKARKPLPEA